MARPHLISSIHPTERLVGQAPAIAALRAQIRHWATFDTLGNPLVPTVVLHGETGTGKGLVAKVMHDSGPRAQGPFLEVNCAAIPDTMLEAELFGFEAGAFTDAKRRKPGLFEAASGGTLFLDEIDALPVVLQGKLLTVIETRRVRRLGAVVEHPVDVKLTVATQADLQACIAAGRFRADLYHRLAVVLLEVPPLRTRGADVVLLAQHCLQRYAEAHRLDPKRLSAGAEAWLQRHPWPGNVRELAHLMERVMLLIPETLINPETLEQLCLPSSQPFALTAARPAEEEVKLGDEAAQIRLTLQQTAGNVVRAARLLGMSRGALRHRMARYGIALPGKQATVMFSPLRQQAARHERATTRQGGNQMVPLWRESPTSAPAWEQKPVAVLAVEVIWPTGNEGTVAACEPCTVVSRWEQTIVEKVTSFGGVVLPHSPSLVVAVFNIPQTLDQAPQRAVQAALALRRLVAEAAEGGASPELRLAVHWGHVLVGTGGSDPAAHPLPVGDTLVRPARLLGSAQPGEILASPEMGRLVGGWCELRAREALLGIGQPDRIGAYTVVGLRPLGSPLAMHRQRPLSRFVGRERELAVLADLLGQAREGQGQLVGIVGEPGVGKSRLCYEFMRAHSIQGWQIFTTSADASGQAIPYLPVIELLQSYFQITSHDGVSARHDKVTDQLRTLGQSLESSLPALLTLLDVPVEDDAWHALEPSHRRQQLLDAIKRLLIRGSQIQPLLLIAENLHWIDTEAQALFDTLVEGLATTRILLLVTYRPEYHHSWGNKTYYTQLRLDPLPRAHAEVLLDSLLGGDASLTPLTQSLWQRTAGNPFFLEESVQTLVDTQVLVGAPGAYRLARLLQSIEVPATVQAVLAARIDRLPPQDKRLLQTAAVIGMEVPCALLQAVAALPEAELYQGLAHLQAAEFLYEASLFPDRTFTFKHALTHEVAYGNLLSERRRILHAHLVETIEALYHDRLAEHVEQLAYHALEGEVWEKALNYCRQAGTKAGTRSAYREAVARFEQALGPLRHLPESRHTLEQAIDVRLDLRAPLQLLGELGRIPTLLRDAATLAEALGDQRRFGQISDRLCAISWQMGDYGPALEYGQRALAISMALGDVRLQFNTNLHLAYTYHALGEYGRAVEYLRTNVVSLEAALPPRPLGPAGDNSVTSRSRLCLCCAELGAFREGITHGEEGMRIAEAAEHPFSCVSAAGGVGYLYLRQGHLHQAIAVLERGVELCRLWHIQLLFPWIASSLGEAYALSGRATEALPILEQAVEQAASMRYILHVSTGLTALGEAYLLGGRPNDAVPLAQRALKMAQQHDERGTQAWIHRLLGEIAAHRDLPELESAEEQYRHALALAESRGMRPLVAHCRLGLGKLYAKLERREQARSELSAAIEMYHAMDMTFWLPQAEAALAQVE
jgi:DNA-binding NtrC family response regulator/tetratricopeptide (TPR) repeat protein